MEYGILLLRLVVGLLFAGHGAQKLFGWFGGGGPAGTAGFFGSLGYRWPAALAVRPLPRSRSPS
jgi:putative oxidoreductase